MCQTLYVKSVTEWCKSKSKMHGQKKHDFDSHYDNDNIFVTTTRNHGKKKIIGEMKVKNEQVISE